MKKIILLITASILLVCMTACAGSQNSGNASGGSNSSTPKTVYDLLDDLADKEYSSIKTDIVTTTDFAELSCNYVLTQGFVTYSVEKLNLLSLDGNITDLSSDYKTTVSGYAQIKNGQVVEFDGDKDVEFPSYNEIKGNFNFDKSNFKNVVEGNNSFEADVIFPSKFYGADVDMSNLKVKVDYTETSLIEITISYSTTNATVVTVYAFEN